MCKHVLYVKHSATHTWVLVNPHGVYVFKLSFCFTIIFHSLFNPPPPLLNSLASPPPTFNSSVAPSFHPPSFMPFLCLPPYFSLVPLPCALPSWPPPSFLFSLCLRLPPRSSFFFFFSLGHPAGLALVLDSSRRLLTWGTHINTHPHTTHICGCYKSVQSSEMVSRLKP